MFTNDLVLNDGTNGAGGTDATFALRGQTMAADGNSWQSLRASTTPLQDKPCTLKISHQESGPANWRTRRSVARIDMTLETTTSVPEPKMDVVSFYVVAVVPLQADNNAALAKKCAGYLQTILKDATSIGKFFTGEV